MVKSVTKAVKHVLRSVLPQAAFDRVVNLKEHLKYQIWGAQPIDTEDRRLLEGPIFEWLNGHMPDNAGLLFIGVAPYTEHYYEMLNAQVFTIDLDPSLAVHGVPDHHIVGSALKLVQYYDPDSFDAIIANGLIGYGLDDGESFAQLLDQSWTCLRRGGVFILGYNNDPYHLNYDPLQYIRASGFSPMTPQAQGIAGYVHQCASENNHCYIFLQKAQ